MKNNFQEIRNGYDSDEEVYFQWLIDAMDAKGYIKEAIYQPQTFELCKERVITYTKITPLKTKTKYEEKTNTWLKTANYTPDWKIIFTSEFLLNTFGAWQDITQNKWSRPKPIFKLSGTDWWVDVKGGFDPNGSYRDFILKQKVMFALHGVYPQKITINNKKESFFNQTFTPEGYMYTNKNGTEKTVHYNPKSLEEFMEMKFL